ncbi:MAG: folate family ECF transporter S component [Firmicutes bacterium]|nr:folate family ECF transporter S component [Bacillota bacterium]
MQRFTSPFSRAYWASAARELKNINTLVFAALMVAIRVILKSVYIPVGENLNIMIVFLPNALGSLVFGPVVSLLAGAASDLLGVLLFPKGAFFPPFTLVEMLSSFLFAIFLYRAPLKFWRVAVSKLSVNAVCNMLFTPLFLSWMSGSAAALMSIPRIAKNVLIFPLESLLLILLLGAMLPVLSRAGLIPKWQTAIKLSARHYALLGVLFLVSIASLLLYLGIFVIPILEFLPPR